MRTTANGAAQINEFINFNLIEQLPGRSHEQREGLRKRKKYDFHEMRSAVPLFVTCSIGRHMVPPNI